MNNQNVRGFHPIYLMAGLYSVVIYIFPVVFYAFNRNLEYDSSIKFWPIMLPLIFGMINILTVIKFKNHLGRIRLLNCSIIIKYSLIPFYIIGGLIIAIALLLMFTPVVIMAFVGPFVATIFTILGWIAMVGAAPFSIGYIRMSYKEGVHGKILSVLAAVFQFFFTVDVFSIMILALKEKRAVKTTITLMVTFLFLIMFSVIWLTLKILGALL